ncbi:MAG: BMP family ABC transporter substrate-binding protein [Tissierellia bacterium]|nr:BMP family ABC transporter substrate-binding protein [Tissierellia bacterium]
MKKRSILALLLAIAMLVALTACGGAEEKPAETTEAEAPAEGENVAEGAKGVIMITDIGGVNDQSFNQSAWEGLTALKEELGDAVEISYIESKQAGDYIPNMETALDGGNALIWGIGYNLSDSIKEAAAANPDQKYGIIDFSYGDETPENVVCAVFKDQENSFLVGYIAGKMTETGKVGFVGGSTSEVILNFENGYKAGVAYAAKEDGKTVDVDVQYAESFGDPAKGKAIATTMYQQGSDIVFHASGGTGDGVIDAAIDANKWVIGVDRDQSEAAPNNMLVSTVKGVGTAMKLISEDLIKNDTFEGGSTKVYGLADKSIDIAYANNDLVKEEVKTATEALKETIAKGELVVPRTNEEFAAFLETLK